MAERNEELEPETGRDLCLVRRDGERRGYRKDILTDTLSERDTVFICVRCQGIMREVCLSSDGEQFCSCCKKEGEQTHPNLKMDNTILSFKCSCPLIVRGCKWLGALGGCEEHLDTCGYVLETCKLRCEIVLQRDELKVHEKEKCPQRIVECEHCSRELKSCELATHLEMCPKMEVSCELKCGVVMCREDVTQHVEQDCVEKEIECPFVKYKCVGLLKRKNLRNHLDEKRMEHLELKMDTMQECISEQNEKISEQNEKISEQNEKISEQNEKISVQNEKISQLSTMNETMSHEIIPLRKEVEILTKFSEAIKFVWRISKVPEVGYGRSIRELFQVAGYNLGFSLHNYFSYLQIEVRPQTGLNDVKLKWPFKAEFVTHLTSQSKPGNIKKFKSEVIEWKREKFNSGAYVCSFPIATFSKCEFLEDFFINGEAEFKIFVIIL